MGTVDVRRCIGTPILEPARPELDVRRSQTLRQDPRDPHPIRDPTRTPTRHLNEGRAPSNSIELSHTEYLAGGPASGTDTGLPHNFFSRWVYPKNTTLV